MINRYASGEAHPEFRGEALTQRLGELGHKRQPGESDREMRRRVFPEIFKRDATAAIEILCGRPANEVHLTVLAIMQHFKRNDFSQDRLPGLADYFFQTLLSA